MASRTFRWWLALGLVIALVVSLGTWELTADLGARATLRQTDRAVAALQQRQRDLEVRLDAAQARLASAGRQRDAAKAALRQVSADLYLTQAALNGANESVYVNVGAIDTLNTCLNGVVEALNQLSIGQRNNAVQSLQAVQQACSKAAPSVG